MVREERVPLLSAARLEVALIVPRGAVVVTGAAGLVGRACVAYLQTTGWRVRGLVRTLTPETAARAQFLPVGDLSTLDDYSLVRALRDAGSVVHLAARVHRPPRGDGDGRNAYRQVNVDVTLRLARAAVAAGVRHFVFASSVKVNGEVTLPGRPFRESDPPDPHDDYARSKWAAEQALAVVAEDNGIRVTALRLPLMYGRGTKANFAALARAIRRGVPLPLAGIDNRRSLLGVDNCGAALAALLASDDTPDRGRLVPYFVADAEAVSTPELVRALAHAMRVTPRLVAVPAAWLRLAGACCGRAAAVERLLGSLEVDTGSFRSRFGWIPPVTLANGLAAAFGATAPL